MENQLYRKTICRGLFDFHVGEAIPEVRLNVADYIAGAAAAGMQTITFMTKDAFGNSYYDTRIGHKNTKLSGDLLGEAIAEAKKHNLAIIAYYNVGLNNHVGGANPDYRQRGADQMPIKEAFGFYDLLCMNSPYRDFVYEQLREIAERYEVSGFFFDITYVWDDCCHCEYCRTAYRNRFGYEAPAAPVPGTKEMAHWQAFQRDIRYRFLRDAADRLKAIRPDFLIGWNHAGDPRFGQVEADRYADYFTSEFHPPHYKYGSLLARWKRSFGKPFELMMPSEMGSWGEWTVAPHETLRTTAAIAVANGGSISFGHVAYPSGELKGSVPRPVMEAVKYANDWVQSLEPWLLEAVSEPQVAVLYSIGSKRMLEASTLPRSLDEATLQGVHRILTEGHIHFDILDEDGLAANISQYELVVLPDQAYVSEELQGIIRDYVRSGGKLLASGRTSLYEANGERCDNFGLSDVFGTAFLDMWLYDVSYLYPLDAALLDNIPDMPLLLKNQALPTLKVSTTTGTKLAGLMEPAVETKVHRHVYHQHAHPAVGTPNPSIVMNTYGKGSCLYIPLPLEAGYWRSGSPWLRNVYLSGLRILNPEPGIVVRAPLSVEVNVMRQPGQSRVIVHLIHVREETAAGSKTFIEEVHPVQEVEISLRLNAGRVQIIPEGTELAVEKRADRVSFIVPPFGLHTAVAVEIIN
ncbi:beta-galactosidase trimerization domain-containing protein [Paenibacillus sp. J5C_2022]|uniref:beta-galactosidase trimerization domain-containing protein n=1 Tax=Paenibacillus sp. J5C2022 TaxID=2977129 RepID=UPI0021D229D8|nr:beta-galactosidase trimerization domain-containing protein [Paenibacillus sp. J5C2022]MCU6709894.1 beta-galactosidase trimerization domain-containing protein [Paenibacillus sp. J5C2022]